MPELLQALKRFCRQPQQWQSPRSAATTLFWPRAALMEKLRGRMIAKAAKPGDLMFPNTIGGVEGHFLRKLQAIAEGAGVVEPELHRFRKSYADTLADEGLPVPTIMNRLGRCSLEVKLEYLRGREAEGEQEQNFAKQAALAG